MASEKKSIIVYADWIDKFEELEDDEAGRLIKHFFRYVNDLNPIAPDRITKLSFLDIEKSLKRDLKKWDDIKIKRSEAGRKSAELRQQKSTSVEQSSTNLTSVKSVEQSSTNSTVNVNCNLLTVNDNVSVNDILLKKETKENINDRKLKFASTLEPFLLTYGKEFINDFYKYWTEPNQSNTKFKKELQKTWSLERRLETWAKNDKNFNNGQNNNSGRANTNNSYVVAKADREKIIRQLTEDAANGNIPGVY